MDPFSTVLHIPQLFIITTLITCNAISCLTGLQWFTGSGDSHRFWIHGAGQVCWLEECTWMYCYSCVLKAAGLRLHALHQHLISASGLANISRLQLVKWSRIAFELLFATWKEKPTTFKKSYLVTWAFNWFM